MYYVAGILTMTSRLQKMTILPIENPGHIHFQERCFQNIFLSVWINCQRKKICGIVHEMQIRKYIPGKTYTVTLDGFIISDNVKCDMYKNINTGYSYSDHDPVYVKFELNKESVLNKFKLKN